jgi:hypothetical protein
MKNENKMSNRTTSASTSAICGLNLRFLLTFTLLGCLLAAACESTKLEGGGADSNPLVAPRTIQITALNEALMVNWTRIAAAQQYDPTYEVWYATSPHVEQAQKWGDEWQHNESNLVSVTITGLTNDVPYYVWVRALYGELGASKFCPMSVGIPVPPPLTPEPRAEAGENLLQISWRADPHAYFYELYYIKGNYGGDSPVSGAEKTMTAEAPVPLDGMETGGLVIGGLENGAEYTVWVKASNTAGDSDYARINGTPQTADSAPDTPEIIEVAPGNGKLTVTWRASQRAAWYSLYYSTSNSFTGATAYSTNIPPFFGRVKAEVLLPAGGNGKRFHIWVKAHNSRGASQESQSESGVPEAPKPINFNDVDFKLGTAQAEYIFSETNPPGPFKTSDQLWDRLTRRKETSLGNLFCDGAAWYIRTKHNEQFDFVFLNGGYLDQPLGRGAVTVGSIESIPPPAARDDFYTVITLKGPELKLLLDQIANVRNMGRGGKNTGAWGMVSREMRYTIKYPDRGSTTNLDLFFYGKIKEGSATLNSVQPDYSENATYRICTANYLASGGDGYTAFVIALRDYSDIANVRNIRVPIWQGVCEYIYDQGTITPYTDGRVKQEGGGVMCDGG